MGPPKIPLAVPIYLLPNEVRGMYLTYGPRYLSRYSLPCPGRRVRSRVRFMDYWQPDSLNCRGRTRIHVPIVMEIVPSYL